MSIVYNLAYSCVPMQWNWFSLSFCRFLYLFRLIRSFAVAAAEWIGCYLSHTHQRIYWAYIYHIFIKFSRTKSICVVYCNRSSLLTKFPRIHSDYPKYTHIQTTSHIHYKQTNCKTMCRMSFNSPCSNIPTIYWIVCEKVSVLNAINLAFSILSHCVFVCHSQSLARSFCLTSAVVVGTAAITSVTW